MRPGVRLRRARLRVRHHRRGHRRRASRPRCARALDRWEPRIAVEEVDFDLSRVGDGQLLINIGYRLRATNHKRNLVYPFYVIPEEEEAE